MLKRCGSQDGWDCNACRRVNLGELLEWYRKDHGTYPRDLAALHWRFCRHPYSPWGLGVSYRRLGPGYELKGEDGWVVKK